MTQSAAYTVVVTGGSGFVASELVKQLLEKGYNVRTTVRSTKNKEKVAHLERLAEALPGTLEFFEADLLKEGSFDEVVSGADYVCHTASPFQMEVEDKQRDLIDPALKGTKNVLNSVARTKSVKRVVLTSSFAAVVKTKSGPKSPPRYTEEDFNTDDTIDTDAYMTSKSLAEKAAWEISKKEGFELVTINPTLVLGPILSARTDATSIKTVKALLEGESDSIIPWVCDVRDIARAHVLGFENPEAKGQRFIVSQRDIYPGKQILDVLKKRFPQIKNMKDGKADEKVEPLLDNTKALKVLGLGQLHDPAESIIDMAVTLIQKGVAKPTFS